MNNSIKTMSARVGCVIASLVVVAGCAATQDSAVSPSTSVEASNASVDKVLVGTGGPLDGYEVTASGFTELPNAPFAGPFATVSTRPGTSDVLYSNYDASSVVLSTVTDAGLAKTRGGALPNNETVQATGWIDQNTFVAVTDDGTVYTGNAIDDTPILMMGPSIGSLATVSKGVGFGVDHIAYDPNSQMLLFTGQQQLSEGSGDQMFIGYATQSRKWFAQKSEMTQIVVTDTGNVYGAYSDEAVQPAPGRVDGWSLDAESGMKRLPLAPYPTGQFPIATALYGDYIVTAGMYINALSIGQDGRLSHSSKTEVTTDSLFPDTNVESAVTTGAGVVIGLKPDSAPDARLGLVTLNSSGTPMAPVAAAQTKVTNAYIMTALNSAGDGASQGASSYTSKSGKSKRCSGNACKKPTPSS